MKLITVFLLALFLAGCGSDSGPVTVAPPSFNLQCDLTKAYTPRADPVVSVASGTATTTVIAMHGKNGGPEVAHMNTLAMDLNAQGYDVIRPYMPWATLSWDGSLCDSMSYINKLIVDEQAKGNKVILLGHSLAGVVTVHYGAQDNARQPDGFVIVAPGHFVPNSIFLAGEHADSINKAKTLIQNGNGDVNDTFETYNGGLVSITTTANIYLSFHGNDQSSDQFPDIKVSIPRVVTPSLWLAGDQDSLTSVADTTLGIIPKAKENSAYTYKVIVGDHFSVMENVTTELDSWFQAL